MRVAIIDDESEIRQMLSDYICRFSEKFDVSIENVAFSSCDSFLKEYKMIWDIIIFDIEMPGTNGLEAARRIRKVDKTVTIIFVTNMAQYAIKGYEVDAVDYIVKPINYYDFSMKFHRTVVKALQKKEHYIMINTEEEIRKIRVAAIKYVEVLGHYLYYHTTKNVYKVRGSMQDVTEELMKFYFVRIHRSYIVNVKYIDKILSKEIIVAGETFQVGRAYKETVKQEYMKYIKGE